jgi:uncharacterized membrane protein YdbT with pleckstrin-like domain
MKKDKIRKTVPLAITLLIIFSGLFVFTQRKNVQENASHKYRNDLVVQHSFLLKTKLAIVECAQLDENDTEYENLRGQVEDRFNSSYQKGFEHYQTLIIKYPDNELLKETEEIYSDLEGILGENEEVIIDRLVKVSNLLRQYLLLIEKSQK